MRSIVLDDLLKDPKIFDLLHQSESLYWKEQITPTCSYCEDDLKTVCRMSFLFANAALVSPIDDIDYGNEAYHLFETYPIENEEALVYFDGIVGYDFKDKAILYYFYVASLALKLNKTISARLILERYNSSRYFEEFDWGQRTLYWILKSLLLLIRKHKGLSDIREALHIINTLRAEQTEFEGTYISSQPIRNQQQTALNLLAIYHVSKAVYETAEYLVGGYSQQQRRINSSIRQHIDIAIRLIDPQSRLRDFFIIIWNDLQFLIKNSVWTYTGFHDNIRQLCRIQAESGLLELLPSQQEALNSNLLNVAANAIVLQMPTSAGKTLMAEFNILVTRSLRPDAKIVYVVPSRALMNQVYFDLKRDLSALNIKVERTSSAVEVDPTEDSFLLSDSIDILVSTPEKLDLLIRRKHPSVEDISLFIVDEAHTIENGQRGARLELLLTMLRRERPDAKYMLLSPFLPDGGESMKDWLGGGNSIKIDWRPSEKLVFGLNLRRNKAHYTVLPTAFSSIVDEECQFETTIQTPLVSLGEKAQILEYTTNTFGELGRTQLILCKGRGTANAQAKTIADRLDRMQNISEDVSLVCKYMDEEIGCHTLYTELIAKGVTVHHAGLSDETKILIEHLIRQGDIRYVCATSTIAEGVNFPVSSVYFDTYYKGGNIPFSANDFWNIAGRAGRTLVDNFGKVILPFNSKQNIRLARSLITKSAECLTSVLAQLFVNREAVLEALAEENAIYKLSNIYPDSFGPLFQYFVHLLNVSENEYVDDVTDLFRDTLAYTLLDDVDKNTFINLCTRIYLRIQDEYSNQRGILKFADKTGFSVPSVLQIMRDKSTIPEVANLESWKPEFMFDGRNVDSLSKKIKVVATLKETQIGSESDVSQFNPTIISRILVSWVKGGKLNEMSTIHPHYATENDTDLRVAEFVRYMNDLRFKASWGLSALEGIVKGNADEMKDSYIPSFIYYGVDDPKSLALRMLGVPRSISKSMSRVIEGNVNNYSFQSIRALLSDLSAERWDELKPQGSTLSGEEWKRVVGILLK